MEILEYNNLNLRRVKKQYLKVTEMLRQGNFKSADVKKLAGTPYYRAKLDRSNRLLFKPTKYQDQEHLLMLEIIENHAYGKSRFLNGANVSESNFKNIAEVSNDAESIGYLNPNNKQINILDKIISFDLEQNDIYQIPLPLIIIGSAGSGKTMLTLEKLKQQTGDILYITHSNYLVKNSRTLYYANNYQN